MRSNPSMTIFGNMTKDPIEKEVNGKPLVEYGVAQNTPDGEVLFFDVTSYGKKGGPFSFLKKGSPVCITGGYRFRTFTKKDGSIGYAHSITQRDLVVLPDGKKGDAPSATTDDTPSF